MIIIKISMHALAEKQKELVQTFLSMIKPIRREKGCLNYQFFRNIENQSIFNLLGEWNSREDLNYHILSDRFSVLLGTRSLLREPPSIHIHTVSQSDGMAMVTTLRKKNIPIATK